MKETTVYNNQLNTVLFKNFNAVELDLFFAICTKMKDKGLRTIRFDFEDLKKLSHYKPTATKRFIADLDKTYTKMLNLQYRNGDEMDYDRFVLFTHFRMKASEGYVEITVNPELEHILNELTHAFTKFELEEFLSIRSSYAKTTYRLLKQYRSTGYYKVPIDKFRELLDIPKSYRMNNITQRVLEPIQAELGQVLEGRQEPIFKDLVINKVKAKKGNRIAYIEFCFEKEPVRVEKSLAEKKQAAVPLYNWLEEES